MYLSEMSKIETIGIKKGVQTLLLFRNALLQLSYIAKILQSFEMCKIYLGKSLYMPATFSNFVVTYNKKHR